MGPMTRRRGGDRPWWKPWGGEKAAYTKSLTGATVAFRVALAVVVLVVGSLLLGLFGLNPIGRARDYVQHMLGSGRVEGVTAAAEPADDAKEFPPEWAVDDYRGRAWTTAGPWPRPPPGPRTPAPASRHPPSAACSC
jgi:hypothetical protein